MKTFFLIIFVWFTSNLFSQNTNLLLLDDIESRTHVLQSKLDLSDAERDRVIKVLYNHAVNVANLNAFSESSNTAYNKLITSRNQSLKNIIGENKLKVFVLLETIEAENLLDDYNELIKVDANKEAINEAIINYRLRYVLPELSQINQEFVSSLSVENIIKLREIRKLYYDFAGDELKENIMFSQSIGQNNKNELIKMITLFKRKMEGKESYFEGLRSKWSNDQDHIAMNLLSDLNLSDRNKNTLSKGQFRMKQDLFVLHVLMIEPYNKTLYLQNLNTVLNQQKNFEKILNHK